MSSYCDQRGMGRRVLRDKLDTKGWMEGIWKWGITAGGGLDA